MSQQETLTPSHLQHWIFDEINERGQTILMVTHSAAASRAKRVLFIKHSLQPNLPGETERQMFRKSRYFDLWQARVN